MTNRKGRGSLAHSTARTCGRTICVVAVSVVLAGCSSTGSTRMNFLPSFTSHGGWLAPRVVHAERRGPARHAPAQSTGARVGKPYVVAGRLYTPRFDPNYDRVGVASWYGGDFQGRSTASGEVFDTNLISAAHPTLPINSIVRVTNLDNGRSLVVRINDRGPFVDNRLIDLSRAAAEQLGFAHHGLARVRVQAVRTASLD
jgi:peptidoglycan lytic transglycosylase